MREIKGQLHRKSDKTQDGQSYYRYWFKFMNGEKVNTIKVRIDEKVKKDYDALLELKEFNTVDLAVHINETKKEAEKATALYKYDFKVVNGNQFRYIRDNNGNSKMYLRLVKYVEEDILQEPLKFPSTSPSLDDMFGKKNEPINDDDMPF